MDVWIDRQMERCEAAQMKGMWGCVKVTLFVTAQLEKRFSRSSYFHSCAKRLFISPPASLRLVQPLYLSLSLFLSLFADGVLSGFLMRCQAFEVEQWRCKRDAIKKAGVQSRERSCASVSTSSSKTSELQAAAAGGGNRRRNRERHEHYR